MAKKASKGLAGSLGFRVLSISLLFLAVPLIVYSGVLYLIDYRQYVRNLYEEIDLMVKEEIAWIHEKESYNQSTLNLIEEFIQSFHLLDNQSHDNQVNKILQKFTIHEDISAIVYSEVTPQGKIICKSSTLPLYVGVDFSKYFTLKELQNMDDNVFIGKDPVYGYSMYIVKYLKEENNKDAIVMSIISLDQLLYKMIEFQKSKELDITIISDKGYVIATTNKKLEDKVFSYEQKDNYLYLEKISYVDGGMKFVLDGKKNLVALKRVPKSSTYLVLSIPEYVIMQKFLTFLFSLGFFLFLVIVIGGVATYLFTLRMARPMKQLNEVMSKAGTGELDISYKSDKYGFEINHLGESFNQMRIDLLKHIEEVKKERGMKEAFEKELQIGHQIQKALLPSEEAHIEGIEIATFYSPATEVAGDFYDYVQLGEEDVLITIADGVGKGISSCLYSFDLRSILKTAALENRSLKELVVRTNTIFCSDTKQSCNFVTAIIGILNKENKTFNFTNAGHLPIIVKRKQQDLELFSTKGIALGIEEFDSIDIKTVTIEQGDFIVLYTDGITEALNQKDELYNEKRLIESIQNYHGESCQELVNIIMDDLHKFVGDKEQHDDISLVVFRLK